MKRIGIVCHVDNPSPALSNALEELVKLAALECGWSEANFEVVEKPPYHGSGTEEHPARHSADNEPNAHS